MACMGRPSLGPLSGRRLGMAVKRIWVAGPRSFENVEWIDRLVGRIAGQYGIAGVILLVGGQTGVDTLVKRCAHERGVHVAEVEALWDKFNHAAGPYRNSKVADLEPHALVAVYWDFDLNPGTASAVKIARKRGIPVKLVKVSIDTGMPSAKAWKDDKAAKKAAGRKRKVK